MDLRCLHTSIFIETPSLEGLPTKAKGDPSPHETRLSPAGHQPSISWYFQCFLIIIVINIIIIYYFNFLSAYVFEALLTCSFFIYKRLFYEILPYQICWKLGRERENNWSITFWFINGNWLSHLTLYITSSIFFDFIFVS